MGKGSTPRPFAVKDDVFSENYCRVFGHNFKAERCVNCGAKPSEGSSTVGESRNGREAAKDGRKDEGNAKQADG